MDLEQADLSDLKSLGWKPGSNGAAANAGRVAGPRTAADTGDMDNNVHPGDTIRLVNALIKAEIRP